MKKIITFLFLHLGIWLQAQEKLLINPVPQKVNFNGTIEKKHFLTQNGNWDLSKIIIGETQNKLLKKFASKLPNSSEGYYISISTKKIYIIGNSPRATFYGKQTLLQLMEKNELPLGEIFDYPNLAHRGVVEGFYGTPWSHEKRLRQLDFYGQNKLNVYIYGPKDDPYHSSPNWRLPYPEKEAQQIKELVTKAKNNFVDFVWAIHPGKDIQWNETDRHHLLSKFEMMYKLGVRAFAVFFDDISGEGTNPNKQAELLNFLHANFVQKKKDVNPLIMCPTEYNKSWSNPNGNYLETLGENLHPSIQIMWTGDRVVADVNKTSMEWINTKIKRKAYIWWNFPVSDYVRDHLLLGAVYGNGNDIKNDMSGFVSNPMEHPEASKIAIYGVANYSWNLEKYNPNITWQSAIATLMPQNKKALYTFAKHNSDLGKNGHRYRRVESETFLPITQNFLENFVKGSNNPYFSDITNEFQEIISASNTLQTTNENPFFTEEIRPWVLQFGLTGKLGLEVMNMYQNFSENRIENFKLAYENVIKLQKELYENDLLHNQNPYQPGVKTASLVVTPFINQMLEKLINSFNLNFSEKLKLSLSFNPNKLISNISQFESVPLLQRGKFIRISPILEIITIKNNLFFGIELEKKSEIKQITINFDTKEALNNGIIQISENGNDWKTITGTIKNTVWTSNTPLENIKSVRFVGNPNSNFQFQMKLFEIELP